MHDSVAPDTADSSNKHRPSRSRSRKRGRRLRGKQSCQSGSCASSMRDVSCWEDIAQWPTHKLSTYASDAQSIGWTDALKTYSDNVACTSTISSAFSGVCADRVADNCSHAQLSPHCQALGIELQKPRYVCSLDYSLECQHEHTALPSGPDHVFSNIMSFATPGLMDKLAGETPPYDFTHVLSLCMEPGAVTTSAPCQKHKHSKRVCVHARCDSHTAGCPCTDHTSWGKCRRLSGPTVFPLAIWIVLRLLLREFWVLIENVPTWPITIVPGP